MTTPDGPALLYDAQPDAVNAPIGPVLVEGGPGTGKSFVLAARAATLLLEGADPKSIFRLTPNVHLVAEIRTTFPSQLMRMNDRVTKEAAEAVQVGTIPGLAESLLRDLGPDTVQVSSDFLRWFPRQSEEVIRQLLSTSTLRARISHEDIPDILRWHRFRRSLFPEAEVPGIPSLWHEIVDLYEQEKRRQNALDTEDITRLAIKAIEGSPDQVRSWREVRRPHLRSHLLVDDFQNLTQCEYRFLHGLMGANGSLVAAGDRRQCVGTWRGADPGLMDRFRKDNPECKHVILSRNFRSTPMLQDLAALLAHRLPAGHLPRNTGPDNLSSGETRGTKPTLRKFHGYKLSTYDAVAARIQSIREQGHDLRELAILMRRRSDIGEMATLLRRYALSFHVLAQDTIDGALPDRENMAVSTFHAAQGRQWRHVFIVDVNDDTVPGPIPPTHDEWLREERRLFYVAATRAQQSLNFVYSTENRNASVSRFLAPILPWLEVNDIELASSEV